MRSLNRWTSGPVRHTTCVRAASKASCASQSGRVAPPQRSGSLPPRLGSLRQVSGLAESDIPRTDPSESHDTSVRRGVIRGAAEELPASVLGIVQHPNNRRTALEYLASGDRGCIRTPRSCRLSACAERAMRLTATASKGCGAARPPRSRAAARDARAWRLESGCSRGPAPDPYGVLVSLVTLGGSSDS
jgi:hypothetical protein